MGVMHGVAKGVLHGCVRLCGRCCRVRQRKERGELTRKGQLVGFTVAAVLVVLTGSAATVADAVTPVKSSDVTLLGKPGELFRSSLDRRVFSQHAQGPVYDEAEHAFATHWDDSNDEGRVGWQNEYWGKTMLCYAGAIAHTQDAALKSWALEKTHAFLKAYQHPDGYLSTYGRKDFLRDNPESDNPRKHWCFNIWGRKYTMWALVELYRVTGDETCLNAAERLMDQMIAQMKRLGVTIDKTGAWAGISSMSILKPLLLLYEARPKAEYLELARHIVRVTDVAERKKPVMNVIHDAFTDRPVVDWFDQPRFLAKAYEIMSFFEGVAAYYRVTGEVRALEATRRFWDHLVREELNPMRGAGYFDHFLHSRFHVNGMTELCDVTHWIRLNRELWLLTGEPKYLDCIEEAFYNAFLAGVSHDGAWGCHIVRSHGTRHLSAPPQTGVKLHQCCPDNMLRTFYDWVETVAATCSDGTVQLNFYSDADVTLPRGEIRIRGGYPVSDGFRIETVFPKGAKLRLRVPSWSKTVTVDGRPMTAANGWCDLAVAPGAKTVSVAFDMSPRILDSEAPEVEDTTKICKDDDIKPAGYTGHFMTWMTDEMKGLVRTRAAAQVMRGPLVLAKGRLAGTTREETFDFTTVNRLGWTASLAPAPRTAANAAAWGAWNLILEKGEAKKTVPVGDFWSLSNVDDPTNWFSLWF